MILVCQLNNCLEILLQNIPLEFWASMLTQMAPVTNTGSPNKTKAHKNERGWVGREGLIGTEGSVGVGSVEHCVHV